MNEDNYVAWCHYRNGRILLCDSDSEGAFKVYRAAFAPRPEGDARDAERYRWLRNRVSGAEYRRLGLAYGEIIDVDALIDAARDAMNDSPK